MTRQTELDTEAELRELAVVSFKLSALYERIHAALVAAMNEIVWLREHTKVASEDVPDYFANRADMDAIGKLLETEEPSAENAVRKSPLTT